MVWWRLGRRGLGLLMTKRKENPQNQGPLHPIRIVDGVALKLCGRCKKELPAENFGFRTSRRLGRRIKSECKECLNKRRTDWKIKNPERMYLLYRRRQIKSDYGLSMETFDLMREMQGNRCAICRETFKERTQKKYYVRGSIAVDHCHTTGRVRGLLCSQCNVGLGSFRDNLEYLESARLYIKHHRELV